MKTKKINTLQISDKLQKIIGAVRLPKKFDEEKELNSYFIKKHVPKERL